MYGSKIWHFEGCSCGSQGSQGKLHQISLNSSKASVRCIRLFSVVSCLFKYVHMYLKTRQQGEAYT